ncbi:MAG: virulence factor SrfB [Paracoccaceae bacterium]|nr:virulence factor SrfB [Paracoccaceae bacterium]
MVANPSIMPIRPVCDWKDEITIVPYSGVQILDFGFSIDALTEIRPLRYVERRGQLDGQLEEWSLIPYTGNEDRDARIEDGRRDDDDEYAIRSVAALEPFLGKWIPIPVLRLKHGGAVPGQEQYDPGPSTWARMRIVELPEVTDGNTHRVQLGLDTALVADDDSIAGRYLAPSHSDAVARREFRFVNDPARMGWFLRRPAPVDPNGRTSDWQMWVTEWLEDLFMRYKRAQRPGRPIEKGDLPHRLEHWARYLTCIAAIETVVRIPRIRLADTVSDRDAVRPVDVDFVLDVGNCRTCGILIESFPDQHGINLAKSFPLELRDLGRPELQYSGLFESRVEFCQADFGSERFSRASGRNKAFFWPSLVRIGPEAMRLIGDEEGTETTSGLSSPKRYLWDDSEVEQEWRFHNHKNRQELPGVAKAAMVRLNEAGDVIAQVESDQKRKLRKRNRALLSPALRSRFSRSSLFGFMLVELIAQALVQINDPASRAGRAQSDLPRRLRRVILTLPTATQVQEQAIIRSRAQGAIRLLWSMNGLQETASVTTGQPELIVEWDEASCTHLVYLYAEILHRFEGQIDHYLRLRGKERPRKEGETPTPSVRLGCIDIGGGTTDLMITTYYSEEGRVLHPVQVFREGFRIAGDELVKGVLEDIVIPQIRDSAEAAGGVSVRERLKELFGADVGGIDQQTIQRRRQFAIRVLAPLATALLEKSEETSEVEMVSLATTDVFGTREREQKRKPNGGEETQPPLALPPRLLAYLEEPLHQAGAMQWRLADLTLNVSQKALARVVRSVFEEAFGNLSEVVAHLDCDILLLTGRPSRLPALRTLVEEKMAVMPDRLVTMHDYRAGSWFPYRDPATDRIGDPKSTVAVGGMVTMLARNSIPNFRVMTDNLRMRSTARFIGEMERNGKILESRVIFSNIDLDSSAGSDEEATVKLFTPVHIGSRQLPLERWITTPLYYLTYANAAAERQAAPISVTLERTLIDDDEGKEAEDVLRREAAQEAFEITYVEAADNTPMKTSDIRLSLHTLGFVDDYWLDSGVFALE